MSLSCVCRLQKEAPCTLPRVLSRAFSSPSKPLTSPFAPRHLLSIADLTPTELSILVRNASHHKQAFKSGSIPRSLLGSLAGRTMAMMFSKRSTRTRVSTEAAIVALGGHPMFLGSSDIQLGVRSTMADARRSAEDFDRSMNLSTIRPSSSRPWSPPLSLASDHIQTWPI